MRTIVVSDMHIGYERSDARAFEDFIDYLLPDKPDNLVLLGDVFDFWRRSDVDLLLEALTQRIVAKLLQFPLTYVRGNHDYEMLKLSSRFPQGPAFPIQTSAMLRNQSSRFVMLHGYELEVFISLESIGIDAYEAFAEAMCHAGQTGGTIASKIYALYSWVKGAFDLSPLIATAEVPPQARLDNKIDDLAKSSSRTIPFGLESGDVFVFGHTHRPFIEKASRTVNTGSWVMDTPDKQQHTYLEITDQSYDLKTWPVSHDMKTQFAHLAAMPKPAHRPNTYLALKAAKRVLDA